MAASISGGGGGRDLFPMPAALGLMIGGAAFLALDVALWLGARIHAALAEARLRRDAVAVDGNDLKPFRGP